MNLSPTIRRSSILKIVVCDRDPIRRLSRKSKNYREYLSDSGQARSVGIAYREVCGLLKEIRAMAALLGKQIKLDQLIIEAAGEGSNLKVDPELSQRPALEIIQHTVCSPSRSVG
jgi:hypothetical protein